ncbi:hypothetical protein D3C85_1411780 [compost metagenome]
MAGMLSIKPPIKSLGILMSLIKLGTFLNKLKKKILNSVGSRLIKSRYSPNFMCAVAALIGLLGSAFELS